MFEYKEVIPEDPETTLTIDNLNKLGRDGWELVWIQKRFACQDFMSYLFKRLVQP